MCLSLPIFWHIRSYQRSFAVDNELEPELKPELIVRHLFHSIGLYSSYVRVKFLWHIGAESQGQPAICINHISG